MSSKADRLQVEEDLMRSRVCGFIGDPGMIEKMSPGEIVLAIRAAIRAVRKYLEADDGAVN